MTDNIFNRNKTNKGTPLGVISSDKTTYQAIDYEAGVIPIFLSMEFIPEDSSTEGASVINYSYIKEMFYKDKTSPEDEDIIILVFDDGVVRLFGHRLKSVLRSVATLQAHVIRQFDPNKHVTASDNQPIITDIIIERSGYSLFGSEDTEEPIIAPAYDKDVLDNINLPPLPSKTNK